jgi:hypothetical protein
VTATPSERTSANILIIRSDYTGAPAIAFNSA